MLDLTTKEIRLALTALLDELRNPDWIYLEPAVPIEPPGFTSTGAKFPKPAYTSVIIEPSPYIPNRGFYLVITRSNLETVKANFSPYRLRSYRELLYKNCQIYRTEIKSQRYYFTWNNRLEREAELALLDILRVCDIHFYV